jgi:hypothetical protein
MTTFAESSRSRAKPARHSVLAAGWSRLGVLGLALGACSGQIAGSGQGNRGADPVTMPGQGGPDNGPAGPGVGPGAPSGPGGGPAMPAPAAAPASGQRLTDRQFVNITSDVFGVDVSTEIATLPLDPKVEGFRNAAVALLPSDLRIEGYSSLAAQVAGKIDWGKQLGGGCAELTDKCQHDFVAGVGRRLFRRPLNDVQIARFSALFGVVKQQGDGFPVAAGLVANAMLQSPEFLYRLEKAGGKVDDFELATRLSFLIWNSAPDDALLDAAAGAQLGTAAAVHTQVTRMLADPRAHRALRDYVDDWLDAERLLRTSRDPDRFPQFTGALASEMRDEIHRLFEKVVWQDDADMTNVLRADRTMITPALAALYGVPAGMGTGLAEQNLAGNPNRQGLLSQPGILTLTSVGGAGSSIVDRGAFVLRNLLCIPIPEPPSNVPELPAAAKGLSERNRLAQHRSDPACGTCHNQIDPLGLAFETYDAIGRFQTMDESGNALTGAGTLKVGDQEVPYSNMREFVAALSRSPALASCMVRKVAQYAFARPLGSADDAVIKDLGARFTEGKGRYQALLTALTESAWARTAGVSQ